MYKLLNTKRGFTLIELLVVISIISLLSSIVIASVNTARERARMASAISFSSQLYRALGAYGGFCIDYNEGSGTTVKNLTGNGVYTILGNNPQTRWSTDTPSGTGSSFSFARSPDSHRISTGPSAGEMISATTRNYTYSSWVKRTGNFGGPIIGQDSGFGHLARLRLGDNGEVDGLFLDNNGSYTETKISSPQNIALGRWHHIAMSVDANKKNIKLLIDGRIVNELTYTISSLRNYGTSPFEIGSFGGSQVGFGVTAMMDDTCLFLGAI